MVPRYGKHYRLISRGIIFDVLWPIWSRYLKVTDTLSILWHLRYQWPWISLRGHVRSSIFAPIESVCMTSYWSSIVTLVLSCRISEMLELLYAKSHFFYIPPLLGSKFQGVPLGVDPWCWGLQTVNMTVHKQSNCIWWWLSCAAATRGVSGSVTSLGTEKNNNKLWTFGFVYSAMKNNNTVIFYAIAKIWKTVTKTALNTKRIADCLPHWHIPRSQCPQCCFKNVQAALQAVRCIASTKTITMDSQLTAAIMR